MRRTQPPSFATWMLEHLTPGERDEALTGDLLESFRSGRTSGWYWRQAFGACVAGWLNHLRERRSLLVFAVIWSLLAPVWIAVQDRIENGSLVSGQMWRMDGPFSGFSSYALWLVLNLSFIWVGMLLYFVSHPNFTQSFSKRKVIRAFALTAPMFLFAYFGTFVLMNLYFFPGPQIDRRTITPTGEITDLRMWADVLRVPYFVTLLCSLWETKRRSRNTATTVADVKDTDSAVLCGATDLVSRPDQWNVKPFFGFMVGAGLLNALMAALLLCRLPGAHTPSLASLFVRALIYLAVCICAGLGSAWFYWNRPASPFRADPPISFGIFVLICAPAWVWAPSAMLLYAQKSPLVVLVAMLGAALLAIGMRNTMPIAPIPAEPILSSRQPEERDIFAESLCVAPIELHGYFVAICIYAASYSLYESWILTAGGLCAVGAFLFTWKWGLTPSHAFNSKRAALRLTSVALPAILLTVWALLEGVSHRNESAAMSAAAAGGDGSRQKPNSRASGRAPGAYESVILWPGPEKTQIILQLPQQTSLLAPGKSRPLIIRFNGPYWYLQPPDNRPGPKAHQACGTPLAVSVESNSSIPLIMEAHQSLGRPISLAHCREIQVEIENRDNRPGAISMAVLLTDSALPKKPTLYLGQQPVVSSEARRYSSNSFSTHETLRFSVPAGTTIREFDEITVMLLPDMERSLVGPKIAIEQFVLLAR
jgi:hypothetical protein